MSLTKQDIDALVDGMERTGLYGENVVTAHPNWAHRETFKRNLYLAAGLTADGQRKPERVRCWLWSYLDGKPFHMAFNDPTDRISVGEDERLTPGWFVPDEETP